MGNSFVETIVGALVIAAAVLFVFYARASVSAGDGGGYELVARFDRVDGITAGSDIRMKGIKIGTVTALDLDPIKVKRVLDEIVRPRLALLKKVGPRETEIIGRGSQGIASQSYVDPQGRRFDLIASPFATPEGGRTLLSQSILSAWIIEFIVLEGRAFNRETKADAILRGLAQDRQKLEAIGIRGQVDLPPYTAFESWDAVAEKMNGRITRRVN